MRRSPARGVPGQLALPPIPGPVTPTGPVRRRLALDFTPPSLDDQGLKQLSDFWSNWLGEHDIKALPDRFTMALGRLVDIGFINPGVLGAARLDEVTSRFTDTRLRPDHGELCSAFDVLAWVRRIHSLAVEDVGLPISAPPGALPMVPHEDMKHVSKVLQHLSRQPRSRGGRSGDGVLRGVDSDSEEAPFDLSSFLSRPESSALPVGWYSDTKRLTALHRYYVKACSRSPARPGFLSDVGFEQWVPPWVGADQGSESRRASVRSFTTGCSNHIGKFLSCVLNFWSSHAAIGICTLNGVFGHHALLLQLCCEKDIAYAVDYERRFVQHVLSCVKKGDSLNLDIALAHPLKDVVGLLESIYAARKEVSGGRVQDGRRLHRDATPSSSGREAVTPKQKARPSSSLKEDSRSPKVESDVNARKPVCFAHDPASGSKCSEKGCTKAHLDTKVAALKERYSKAKAAFDKSRGSPKTPTTKE